MPNAHSIEPTRPCAACDGVGRASYDPSRVCPWCHGNRSFTAPDFGAITKAVLGRKGLRSQAPTEDRSYYVWRLARFYGGKDVCLPVVAMVRIKGDPYKIELDALAALLARRLFGTDLAGPHRWGRALGLVDKDIPGLPATAYAGAPVLGPGVTKPHEEEEEIR